MAKQFTDDNFQTEVENSDRIVLVDFWASWCGPCMMVSPIIDELSEEYSNDATVLIGKVNVDECRGVAGKYGIMSIPTVLVFKDGKVVETVVGARGKQDYKSLIEKHKE